MQVPLEKKLHGYWQVRFGHLPVFKGPSTANLIYPHMIRTVPCIAMQVFSYLGTTYTSVSSGTITPSSTAKAPHYCESLLLGNPKVPKGFKSYFASRTFFEDTYFNFFIHKLSLMRRRFFYTFLDFS